MDHRLHIQFVIDVDNHPTNTVHDRSIILESGQADNGAKYRQTIDAIESHLARALPLSKNDLTGHQSQVQCRLIYMFDK